MPWCDGCARYFAPSALHRDGSCPVCDAQVVETVADEVKAPPKAPWHFKLLVVAAGGYLLWRAVQGVIWVVT